MALVMAFDMALSVFALFEIETARPTRRATTVQL
ncbi:hypothetical protein AGROH133_04231 [Agrobacterium tumefaciens]|nr:hypothetical protein AGROH133_04231 [Agrobacterium tumefaciens]